MDTKKKELLGNFYRDGKIDTQETIETNDHDFEARGSRCGDPPTVSTMWGRTRGSSTLTPATTPANWPVTAWQRGGTSKAGPTIRRAQKLAGVVAMAAAATARPCICSRKTSRSWPSRLGIEIRVAHYPPYCSKYNPIEHRLFPHLTRACRGVIFHTLETVRYYMAKAETTTGMRVKVSILDKVYATGRKLDRGIQEGHEDRVRQLPSQMELYSRSRASMRLRDRELIP